MAMIEDLTQSASVTRNSDGFQAERVFYVDGLSGSPPAIVYNATIESGIPQYGDAHPIIPNTFVNNVQGALAVDSKSQAIVTVSYGQLASNDRPPNEADPVEWSTESTLQEVETTKDAFGNEVLLSHTYDADTDSPRTETQLVKIRVMRPLTILRGRRKEEEDPKYKAAAYAGTINATNFLNDGPHYWLCAKIGGTTNDGGESFLVEYEFQRNEFTWNPEVAFFDNEKNEHPQGLVQGKGIKRVQVYPEANWDPLRINS